VRGDDDVDGTSHSPARGRAPVRRPRDTATVRLVRRRRSCRDRPDARVAWLSAAEVDRSAGGLDSSTPSSTWRRSSRLRSIRDVAPSITRSVSAGAPYGGAAPLGTGILAAAAGMAMRRPAAPAQQAERAKEGRRLIEPARRPVSSPPSFAQRDELRFPRGRHSRFSSAFWVSCRGPDTRRDHVNSMTASLPPGSPASVAVWRRQAAIRPLPGPSGPLRGLNRAAAASRIGSRGGRRPQTRRRFVLLGQPKHRILRPERRS